MQMLWNMDKGEMGKRHVLFQEEDKDTYIRTMLETVTWKIRMRKNEFVARSAGSALIVVALATAARSRPLRLVGEVLIRSYAVQGTQISDLRLPQPRLPSAPPLPPR